jgi:hypothetical protein
MRHFRPYPIADRGLSGFFNGSFWVRNGRIPPISTIGGTVESLLAALIPRATEKDRTPEVKLE